MAAEQTLRDMLVADTALNNMIERRIYPDVIPQAVSLPAIAYDRVNTETITTIHGPVAAAFVTLQIMVWANTRVESEQIADAVIAVLQAAKEPYVARGSEFDEDSQAYGTSIEVTLFETT